MPMGEGMTSRAQCDHAEVEIKRDEGRKRSAWAGIIDCRIVLLALHSSSNLQVVSCNKLYCADWAGGG